MAVSEKTNCEEGRVMEREKELLGENIEDLNEKIKKLASDLRGLLDVDCAMGVCSYNPEVDDLHAKMKEVEEKKKILKRLQANLDACATE
jgi:hypothetical protein